MANTLLTADIVAKEAVLQLDNALIMGNRVYRGYEEEFSKNVNGYDVGQTISVKRPMDFTVRSGRTVNLQDTTQGKFTMTVNTFKGIDFSFTTQDLTQNISSLSESDIKPAMIQLANTVDQSCMGLYKDVPSWVGTPGQTINSNQDFIKGPERMDEYANPQDGRAAILSPADHWGLIGGQTTLYSEKLVDAAYTRGELKRVAGIDNYMSQNVPTHTVGTYSGTSLTKGAGQETTYAATMNTDQQTLITDGWGSGTTTLNAGDVFTIANVYAVNPVTKAALPFLKQFVVVNTISDTSGDITLTMSPAAILTGAHQTVSATIADGAAITMVGTSNTGYRQNMIFNKNAFALAVVPLVLPVSEKGAARQSYKGLSVRVIPGYSFVDDVCKWRLDILYGVKTIDKRLAHRMSGTA